MAEEIVSPLTEEEMEEAKKNQEAQAELAKKFQEERMEKVVITAREKLLPFLKEQNKTIEESRRIVETLSVTINQGLFLLMKKVCVEELDLPGKINENYPDYENFLKLIRSLESETMEDAIESLQWMGAKMDATLKAENKDRDFASLNLDF